jgi:propionyl-CoA carboxylase alpha chain/3-methylcrotonyl-CoA carboxylase alpha subunit/acetyl-CoA/propionyl-CoA carboxylase biotin carboxyl carrier protein
VLKLRIPHGADARFDTGVGEGQQVTAAFDPLLAKLIVRGKDREDARMRAHAALRELALLGCETNTTFLRRVINHEAFAAGQIHTGFLDAHPEIAVEPPMARHLTDKLLAIASLSTRAVRDAADAVPALHAAMGAWRN